jgi:peroxiredoxin
MLTAVLTILSCGGSEPSPEETTLTEVGQAAPEFEVTTLEGESFSLSGQRDRVVVVNFFATWCPPCREELPHLEREVWQRFRGDAFSLVALGREHTAEELEPFAEESGFSFPIAPDPERAAYARYAQMHIPRTVVVGPDGTILFQFQGFERSDFNRMIDVIDQALSDLAEERPAA